MDDSFFFKTSDGLSQAKFEDEQNRSWFRMGKKVVKKWSNWGAWEDFWENLRNMTDTEKMMMTNIIGNFVADNIVFEVSKIGPVDPEIWAKKVVKITERISWAIWKIESSIQRQSYRKCYGGQYCLWKWSASSSSWGIILNNFFLLCSCSCRAFVIWFSIKKRSKTQKFWSRTFFILCFLICFFFMDTMMMYNEGGQSFGSPR